eukprot:COSAG05_NODE_1751_length_4143_cov_2.852621_5_plen_98_part_00
MIRAYNKEETTCSALRTSWAILAAWSSMLSAIFRAFLRLSSAAGLSPLDRSACARVRIRLARVKPAWVASICGLGGSSSSSLEYSDSLPSFGGLLLS